MTDSEKQELLEAIKAESTDVTELSEVSSLDSINSLPAMKGTELVSVPIKLLTAPADEAVTLANAAAAKANAAAATATNAGDAASKAATEATEAAAKATDAAEKIGDLDTTVEEAIAQEAEARKQADADEVIARDTAIAAEATLRETEDNMLQKQIQDENARALEAEANLQEAIDNHQSGNTYNVTARVPLASGDYYTLATAIAAVPTKDRTLGMCITYATGVGKWEMKQFVGTSLDSWETVASWADAGGGGTVKQITVNGTTNNPDDDGNVAITVPTTEVDSSLTPGGTNPVEGAAIYQAIENVRTPTWNADVDNSSSDSESVVTLSTDDGHEVCSFAVPKGSGGGGGDTSSGKILVTASLNKTLMKLGDTLTLDWSYDHVDDDGVSDGRDATVLVTVKIGTATVFSQTNNSVTAGTSRTLDLTNYVQAGNVQVYVKATTELDDGRTQTKQAYVKAEVKDFNISTDFSPASSLSKGGFADGDTININVTVTGSGSRAVNMYLDGASTPTTLSAIGGTATVAFQINARTLTAGKHFVQLVAELDGLKSDSLYIEFCKAGAGAFVGLSLANPEGTIITGKTTRPTLTVGQYNEASFKYAAYDPGALPAQVTIKAGSDTSIVSASRSLQTYSNRFTEQGTKTLSLSVGGASTSLSLNVTESSVEIAETTADLELKLTANGRSNTEATPATWENNGYSTKFSGFDWATNGWMSDGESTALLLKGGARAVVNIQPFLEDMVVSGATIEIEYQVKNLAEREGTLIECIESTGNGQRGFKVTGQTAMFYTGSTRTTEDDENVDEDGNPIKVVTNVGVEGTFATDRRVKLAFVIGKKSEYRLMELYMNGIRTAAMTYDTNDSLKQDTPQYLTLGGDGAELYVYAIRIYKRPLTDDQCVNNYIVDRPTSASMGELYEDNDILGETSQPDMQTLIQKGKSVIFIVRSSDSGNGLDDVNASTNKKEDFAVDMMYIYTPWATLQLKHFKMRIQGTSSTKYPVKNYRFYCSKNVGSSTEQPEFYIDGVLQDNQKVPLFEGDTHPSKVLCAKADFSDSSMASNTGQAKVWNDLFYNIDPTPPQKNDPTIRSCIYGFPCDVFAATSEDDANPTYYGQYNLNNDKSDWYEVTGMNEKLANGNDIVAGHIIALEFLNNSAKLGLFQVESDFDTQATKEFDSALEFNYPKDTFWTDADTEGGEAIASDDMKADIKRLWEWVRDCVPATADIATYKDVSTFKSDKFKNEVAQYFSLTNLLAWYICTDYDANVDQRVKNMILRTWDGKIWRFTYYDGDCAFGKRNDSMLKYAYNVNRDTYDAEMQKYAFEGHDSVLWCLVLANFESELKTVAQSVRTVMTNNVVLNMMLTEQAANWCRRLFNRSGEMKYITPETKGVTVSSGGVTTTGNKYYYMYALAGSREMQLRHFITNRNALLDAKYSLGTFREDCIPCYLSRSAANAEDVMKIVSSDEYYFGYGTNNTNNKQLTDKVEENGEARLTFTEAFAMNDPLRIYGASRMRELDMTGFAAGHLIGYWDLSNCSSLRVLNCSAPDANPAATSFYIGLSSCAQLRKVDFSYQTNAKTNKDNAVIDLSAQSLLEYADLQGTSIVSATFAKGAPLVYLHLPATITTLRLEYLDKLTKSGLVVDGYDNVKTLIFDSCQSLDWQTIYEQCTNLTTLRVVGVTMSGDGSDLTAMMERGLNGIDDDDATVGHAVLKGNYRLTQFVDNIDELRAYFGDDLTISEPEFTMIKQDDTMEDPWNVTNCENGTTGDPDNGGNYAASGHISKIWQDCIVPCFGILNAKTGRWEGKRLSDSNYHQLYDGSDYDYTDANDGSGKDAMMRVRCWYKGINDYKNQAKYTCLSSNAADKEPASSATVCNRYTTSNLLYQSRQVVDITSVTAGTSKISDEDIWSASTSNSTYRVSVKDMKQIRWPGVNSSSYGIVFTDADGLILSTFKMFNGGSQFDFNISIGDYVFTDVPEGAAYAYFTARETNASEETIVVDSSEIEAIEPDWCYDDFMVGIYQMSVNSSMLPRSIPSSVVKTGTGTQVTSASWVYDSDGKPTGDVPDTLNFTSKDFQNIAEIRGDGYQLVDYEMSKLLAILFFAIYGTRDSSKYCGYGSFNTSAGYSDTLPGKLTTRRKSNNKVSDSLTGTTNINGNKVLGIESLFGCVYEWTSNTLINVPTFAQAKKDKMVDNISSYPIDAKFHIYDPVAKTERVVQGMTNNGVCISRTRHGRHCDVIASATNGDSSLWSKAYGDGMWYNASRCRVFGRSSAYGYAYGGLVYAHSYNASSNSSSNHGARLAFRGDITVSE